MKPPVDQIYKSSKKTHRTYKPKHTYPHTSKPTYLQTLQQYTHSSEFTHIHQLLATKPNQQTKPKTKKQKQNKTKKKKKKTNEIKINREIENITKEKGRVITTATIGGGSGVCRPVVDGWVHGSRSFRVE